jgi:hypothetical protein
MQKSVSQMHKYVLGLTGVMGLFAITLFVAIWRVSSSTKFAGQPFHSQTCTSQQSKHVTISWLATCSKMRVEPVPSPRQGSQAHP